MEGQGGGEAQGVADPKKVKKWGKSASLYIWISSSQLSMAQFSILSAFWARMR
jgi:hypothetical protein